MTTAATLDNRENQKAPISISGLKRPYRAAMRRFKRDTNGSFAIEFAAVSGPFLALVFGLFGIAFFFFIMNSLEKGMDQMSRLIRTGQAADTQMTVQDFKEGICTKAGAWLRCSALEVFVTKYPSWAAVTPQPCVSQSGVVKNSAPASAKIADYSGDASDIVIVTACYKWDFPQNLPFLTIGNMPDKSYMMQAATAFRSEPFEKN